MAESHVVAVPLYVGYISKITNLDNSPGVVLYLESIVEISGHKKQSRYQIQLSKSLHAFKLDIHTQHNYIMADDKEKIISDEVLRELRDKHGGHETPVGSVFDKTESHFILKKQSQMGACNRQKGKN